MIRPLEAKTDCSLGTTGVVPGADTEGEEGSAAERTVGADIILSMNPFSIAKTSWSPGDTREVEQERLRKEIGVEYDSYRRLYLADGHEWRIAGQIAREDGKKYYILECVG